jgi:hypothetical protein
LPSTVVTYDLYERLVAAKAGVTTVQTAAQIDASILPRSCRLRNIHYPNVSPNTTSGSPLIVKDLTGSEITRIDPGQAYLEDSRMNNIPLVGVGLNAPVNNALVDVVVEIA